VNPDKVIETRNLVASIEQKLMLEELANLRKRLDNLERGRKPEDRPLDWAPELD